MKSFRLPHSDVEVVLSDAFSKDKLSNFINQIIIGGIDLKEFKADPIQQLQELGIFIKSEDITKLNKIDFLSLSEIRKDLVGQPAIVAQVAVAVAISLVPI